MEKRKNTLDIYSHIKLIPTTEAINLYMIKEADLLPILLCGQIFRWDFLYSENVSLYLSG
ncbi:hypothetical protein SRABI27_05095 [Pedobacter sp. Bi27]|nr:hypothetical protein SRABI36_05063 [Pedobacter sp. Bi36]CAH0317766.1 hypothetical protein SRABI27_05095 [Pedobacter sp. Bi27]CAH0318872.1 hypothetical protein SRABI126_05154 [Pedobacter sp. Bi126]